MHRAPGFDPPTASPAVREVLRGIRHALGTASRSKTPATAALIAQIPPRRSSWLRSMASMPILLKNPRFTPPQSNIQLCGAMRCR